MGKKIVIAVTGASGSVYADVLLKKLMQLTEQWDELSLVIMNCAILHNRILMRRLHPDQDSTIPGSSFPAAWVHWGVLLRVFPTT